jgi:D-glycero-D-manno-heptose 1,7-bisphosphate phosphatase
MKTLALFLDRDGVVNKETDYVCRIEAFNFVENIFRLCKIFQTKGYGIFIITNQSGISRGYYSENDYLVLTDWMLSRFLENGITISKVYYCPHHPDISGPCNCRKPNPGLIEQAEIEFNLDLSNSILIGDNISDIMAGKSAGVGTNILIPTNILPKYLFSDFS